MQQANEIRLEKRGAVTLFDIRGDITAFSEPFLNDAYGKADAQAADKLLFNFDKDAYINSGGIAVLIQILAQTRKNNQRIGISGLSDHFVKIFNMVGITKFADIHTSVETALSALGTDA